MRNTRAIRLFAALLLVQVLTACGGGGGGSGGSGGTPAAATFIQGTIGGNTFSIPCDQLTKDFSASYLAGKTLDFGDFVSASTGIAFKVVFPTHISGYTAQSTSPNRPTLAYGGFESASAGNTLALGMKIPAQSVSGVSSTYNSLHIDPAVQPQYYTQLVSATEIARNAGTSVMLVDLVFQLPMSTDGSTIAATLVNGELKIKVTVSNIGA